jgi:hypothetical protein
MKRVFRPYWEWECVAAGMYATHSPEGLKAAECKEAYAAFLRDDERFRDAIHRVFVEWPNSCDHFLLNDAINRLAWIGQSAMCIATGVPERFKSGFVLLSHDERAKANLTAKEALDVWIFAKQHDCTFKSGERWDTLRTYPTSALNASQS